MDKETIRNKIKETEEQMKEIKTQAESTLNFLSGKLEVYKEMLEEPEEEEE